jgi:MFS family permease
VFAGAAGRRKSGLIRRFPLLAIRDFRLLLADRILAPASFAFSIVGVSFAVLNLTHGSTTALSYVLAAQIAPSLVFVLVGGVIADRIAPQKVIVAGNAMIALGEGAFGLLVLAGHPALWLMIALECVTGTGMALFYPASTALLPRIVPAASMQQASAISRLAMNAAQMGGAVLAGFCVAAIGAGWALTICGVGMLGTLPLMLALRVSPAERSHEASLLRDLREGWSEFRSRSWIWVTTLQYAVVMMSWYGAFTVLGPAVARAHLGGPAAWGAITGAESLGLIAGGMASLRISVARPIRFVVLSGAAIALAPLALAMLWPLPLICVEALLVGIVMEIMMVQWTVALATNVRPDILARVSSYDALGVVLAMPAGALIAGPLAAWTSVAHTQYGAAALIVVASALAFIPRTVRQFRNGQEGLEPAIEPGPAGLAPAGPDLIEPGPPDEAAPALAGSG